MKRQLQDICAEIGTLKSALGCAVAAGALGTVHCEETARLEEKDIAAQTTEAYAAGEAAGRAEGERQASEERAAREAAEASVREIAVRVTSLEAEAVARDVEGAALRSSKDDLAIDLKESELALLTANKKMLVLAQSMAECKRSRVLELAATEDVSRRLVERTSRAQREEPKCFAAQVAAQDRRAEGMRAPVPGQATVRIQDFEID